MLTYQARIVFDCVSEPQTLLFGSQCSCSNCVLSVFESRYPKLLELINVLAVDIAPLSESSQALIIDGSLAPSLKLIGKD